MLYQIIDGTVSAGGKTILSHIDFYIKEKEKIAVVGRNGAGKTTLMRLLAGEITPDRDDKRKQNAGVSVSRSITIGMLKQNDASNQGKTVEEILLEGCPGKDTYSKERFDYETEYDKLFTGFGFDKESKSRKLSSFSGGEQTKISLIKLLLEKPDLLLLDEPTNHLDIKTVEWLENYLADYGSAVVIVSHDRAFLDAAVGTVYELEHGKLYRYAGNYTAYRKQKLKNIQIQKKAYEKQQQQIAHENELIEKFKHKPTKAAFARSRKSMLARMKLVEKPVDDEANIFTGKIEPQFPGGKWVYEAENLKIGYDKKSILELSLRIRRGQKIAVIGDNGVGKSTFLKTAAGIIEPVGGKSQLGNNLLIGYFDQQAALIESEKTVREYFHELFPAMPEKELRNTLASYLFKGADAAKQINVLSGGEKSRLLLAELITGRPNVLILDEPTNHMDIPAKETLESAFKAYTGTMLFVSHDRYFVKQVADALLVFSDDKVMYYPFGYEHYMTRMRQSEDGELAALMQSKDQAMVAALKAVPKPERHQSRQLTTEEAYADWKLRLAAEPMNAKMKIAEDIYNEMCILAQKADEQYWKNETAEGSSQNEVEAENARYPQSEADAENARYPQSEAEAENTRYLQNDGYIKKYAQSIQEYEAACEEWTLECLEWYNIYSELY